MERIWGMRAVLFLFTKKLEKRVDITAKLDKFS